MKNKKFLGIPLTLFIIGLLVVGGASAILVDYLSNTATAEVEVTSPMLIELATAESWEDARTDGISYTSGWQNSVTDATTGYGTLYYGVKVENLADVTIANKTLEIVMSNNNSNAECEDLTSLTFVDIGVTDPSSDYYDPQNLEGLCDDANGVPGTVTFEIPINSLDAGTVYEYPVTMTFGNVEEASYNFSATLVE